MIVEHNVTIRHEHDEVDNIEVYCMDEWAEFERKRTCHQNYFRAMGCYECSACGGLATLPTKYCPNCGARVVENAEDDAK